MFPRKGKWFLVDRLAMWINLNKASPLFHAAVDYLVPSVAALMNKSGRRDDDLVRRNVSACQVYLHSPTEQQIHQLGNVSAAVSFIDYGIERPPRNGNVTFSLLAKDQICGA